MRPLSAAEIAELRKDLADVEQQLEATQKLSPGRAITEGRLDFGAILRIISGASALVGEKP